MTSKAKGKGLTASKAYVDSWVTPVRVHIFEIFDIDERKFSIFHREYHLFRANPVNRMLTNSVRIHDHGDIVPNDIYLLNEENKSHRNALQLPYRILLQSTDGNVSAICFANEETFLQTAGKIIEQTTVNPQNPVYDRYDIEQHPVHKTQEAQGQLTAR